MKSFTRHGSFHAHTAADAASSPLSAGHQVRRFVKVAIAISVAAACLLQGAHASALEKKLVTTHYAQEQGWSCGVNVARMWCKFISPANNYTESNMTPYTGTDGTTIPELIQAIYVNTPASYCFAEWEYANKFEAVKGVAWTLEKLDQPLALAGQVYNGAPGGHYYLMRGYKGTGAVGADAYTGYPNFSIEGIYVEDTVYGSSYYANLPIGQYAVAPNTLITSSSLTTSYWTPIGGLFDKKYRSVERVTDCNQHGMTLENNTVRASY